MENSSFPAVQETGAPVIGQRETRVARIRALNDEFRASLDNDEHCYVSRGVGELGSWFMRRAGEEVERFDAFDDDNDPYGEHDFGALSVMDERICWKIDYYDRSMQAGSADSADPIATVRVITIMLAREY